MKSKIIATILFATVLPSAAAGSTVSKSEARGAAGGKAVDAAQARDEIMIQVRGNGEIILAGKVLTLEGLKSFLKERADLKEKPTVRIRGDAEVAYQRIVEVIEVCR